MNLIQKSIVFAISLLLLQLLIVGCLILSLTEEQRKVEEVSYSHRAESACAEISVFFQDAIHDLITLAGTGNKVFAERYDDAVSHLRTKVEELKHEPLASEQDKKDIEKIYRSSSYLLFLFDKFRNQSREREASVSIPGYLSRLQLELQPYITDMMRSIRDFSNRHKAIEHSASQHLDSSQAIKTLATYVFVVNIATTVLIIIGFSSGVVKRLAIIRDNFKRYASKIVLHPTQRGHDEITDLDREFHTLCAALTEASAKEQAIFANMPVGLINCRDREVIESVNPVIEHLIGSVPPGTKLEELLNDKLSDAAPLQQLLTGSSSGPCRLRLKSVHCDSFPGEVTVSRFQHQGEEKLIVAVLDVSEREEIEKLRQEFVNIVSHDIRSPLTAISASLTLFGKGLLGELNPKGINKLEAINHEIDRLMRLTGDLLDIARIEAGNIPLVKDDCSVLELMEQAVQSTLPNADRKQVTLDVEPTELHVTADPNRVLQILINLLSNAVKFTPTGKCVYLCAHEIGTSIRISVQDEGCGIPEADQRTIFERFRQVRQEDANRGTGLGLAICRLLAEAHGGSVGLKSTLNEGSTFWLELPSGNEAKPPIDQSA